MLSIYCGEFYAVPLPIKAMNKLTYLLIGVTFLSSWTFLTPNELLTFKEKEVIAHRVLHRLFESVGTYSLKKCPALEIYQHSDSPIYYHEGRTIYLSQQWIDVCLENKNIGETGLAIILAHELHHFFQNEKGTFYGSLPKGAQAKEKDADKFGLFYCYLAGYKNIDTVHPILLQTVYQVFKLNKKALNYPTLAQRELSDQALRQQAKEAYHLFKVATYLTLNGTYHKALIFYRQLAASQLMTKEMYNNYGMAQAMSQLTNGNGSWLYLAYPFEIAYHSPLLVELSRTGTIKKVALPNAIALFQKALTQDATYEPAILNLLTAYAAGGDLVNFNAFFSKCQSIIQQNKRLKEKIEFARILCEFNQKDSDKTIRGQAIERLIGLKKRSPLNQSIIQTNINSLQSPNSSMYTPKVQKTFIGTRWDCLDYSFPKEETQSISINMDAEYSFTYYEMGSGKTIYQLKWELGYDKHTFVHQINTSELNCEIIQNRVAPAQSPYYLFGEYFSLHPFYPNIILGTTANTPEITQIWYSF